MPREQTEACPAFHPEEAGIMLDRLAVELLHALAKNPDAVPPLQTAADELLACVGVWLAAIDGDELPMNARLVAVDTEPSVLAQTLHDLGEQLLAMAEIVGATHNPGGLIATDFDPRSFANALDMLRAELEGELSGPDPQVALQTLKREIGSVVAQARSWAIDHGSRFDFIEAPANCDAVDCILVLRRLADALRELAARDALRVVNDNATAGEGED
jgi:hypothetical protein